MKREDYTNTEGLYTVDLSGKRMTKEAADAIIEYNKNKASHPAFIPSDYIYYIYKEKTIKYDFVNHKAYLLSDNEWEYSAELTQLLMNNPNALERKYNVFENYPISQRETTEKVVQPPSNNQVLNSQNFQPNNSNQIKYIKLINGDIAKVNEDNMTFYILDLSTKSWQSKPALFSEFEYGNLSYTNIEFDDIYPNQEDLDQSKGIKL